VEHQGTVDQEYSLIESASLADELEKEWLAFNQDCDTWIDGRVCYINPMTCHSHKLTLFSDTKGKNG
jgi:hypothetical protein